MMLKPFAQIGQKALKKATLCLVEGSWNLNFKHLCISYEFDRQFFEWFKSWTLHCDTSLIKS